MLAPRLRAIDPHQPVPYFGASSQAILHAIHAVCVQRRSTTGAPRRSRASITGSRSIAEATHDHPQRYRTIATHAADPKLAIRMTPQGLAGSFTSTSRRSGDHPTTDSVVAGATVADRGVSDPVGIEACEVLAVLSRAVVEISDRVSSLWATTGPSTAKTSTGGAVPT